MMYISPEDPVENPDLAVAIVFRIVDADGNVWRSAPYIGDILTGKNGLDSDGMAQWIRIPTLRHLLPDTHAQIEVYVGNPDLKLFSVLANDPTVDYLDYCPNFDVVGSPLPAELVGSVIPTIAEAIATKGLDREVLYTTGDALANDPPPQSRALTLWRNRVIAVNGTSIYPSQEIEDGLGLRWNDTLRTEWKDGTGDIVGISPIDWNFCAVFKTDAVGVIDGPGPDGLGVGTYIVRTLTTKKGCSNPRSIVSGPDGCYFQDATTKRLCVVTPQMDVVECAPGWFNEGAAADVKACAHIESERQNWFATTNDEIVVIDYKHRSETSAFGKVYVWDVSSVGAPVGITVISGVPFVVFDDGSLADFTRTGFYDSVEIVEDNQKTQVLSPIEMQIETGELQPFGLQGMGDVCMIQMLGEFFGPHGISLTVKPQYQSDGHTFSIDILDGPEQFGVGPPNCQRVQSVRVSIKEVALTDGETGEKILNRGFKFVGLAMEVQPRGRVQQLPVGRIL